MKIALGTVQWGLDYGIANKSGVPLDEELKSILDFAKQIKVNMFDTAIQYGNAEERIGKLLNKGNKIVTKIGGFTKSNDVNYQIMSSLKRLKKKTLYGCLFHSYNELAQNPNFWTQLNEIKKKGTIEKIGYSIYEPKELEHLLMMKMKPDLVQIPYNILNRKFEPYLEKLKSLNTEIHVRSIFLQGLLFKPLFKIPLQLYSLKPALREINELCESLGLTKLELLLGFVLNNPNIDFVVVGVETKNQLEEIFKAQEGDIIKAKRNKIRAIYVKDNKLLNPNNWK